VQLAGVYGVISYFMGTSLGRTGTFRLIGYSWPLFWIALPYLLSRSGLNIRFAENLFLVTASLVTAWIPNLSNFVGLNHTVTFWLFGIPILYVATAVCLNRIELRPRSSAGACFLIPPLNVKTAGSRAKED
jgi:hypothetical protein